MKLDIKIKKVTADETNIFLKLLNFRYKYYVEKLKYIGASDDMDLLKLEYDKYDKNAIHYYINNGGDEIIAYARVIKNSMPKPIIDKTTVGNMNIIKNKKVTEISRLIISDEKRHTHILPMLVVELYKYLISSDTDIVLIDTFVGSDSYKIFKKLGFEDLDYLYNDGEYKVTKKSSILYLDLLEFQYKLKYRPEKCHKSFERLLILVEGRK
ncbi:GNAT family N-acetyltransferase [Anaerovorax odorimutans]|uniref:GNAT family N-acetyltransferase n=1 Tax=Anaerovorax odorimutans TaxID=109327 RepID=A0ABT1RUF7_9FIRM|nr:GNAT family N-acyltransferase [Anaerovorax odorimutans]MCQ4638486.1 GNAT family N-acetyltransferase [Anaerovorax odorimutans]